MNKGVISLEHCGMTEQVADVFTKALKRESFEGLRASLECALLRIS